MKAETFKPRLSLAEIPYWAARYNSSADSAIENELAPAAGTRGYLTHADLVELGRWKSARNVPRLAANEPEFVKAVTTIALSTPNERLRIEVLSLLRGVGWPTASVILHWCHRDPYPILDYRALWSLGFDSLPVYDFTFWEAYTHACRQLAGQAGVTMRELDRALWQYSWENQ